MHYLQSTESASLTNAFFHPSFHFSSLFCLFLSFFFRFSKISKHGIRLKCFGSIHKIKYTKVGPRSSAVNSRKSILAMPAIKRVSLGLTTKVLGTIIFFGSMAISSSRVKIFKTCKKIYKDSNKITIIISKLK